MPLRFILGEPGTGKTHLCLQEIESNINRGVPLVYLVPEQFSLQSERVLLTNRNAATQVQVLSFNRLAHRLFASFGGVPGKLVDDLGKQMLLRKVLFEVEDKLTYYKSAASKHGFVDNLAHTISELSHHCVTADKLLQVSEGGGTVLDAKTNDIAIISTAYRKMVKGQYLLTDDMLDLLCAQLDNMQSCPILDAGVIWVDGFAGFTPQERQVLLRIMKRAARVNITLTTAPDPLLTAPGVTKERICSLATSTGILVENDTILRVNHRNSQGIMGFVQNFRMLNGCKPAAHTNDITLISAPERYAAVNSAASHILKLVNEENYRFKDIAVLCGDRKQYEKILQATFDRLNIPLFVDTEGDILAHPLTEMIRALLDIVIYNWNFDSVFRLLKTQLTNIDLDEIDMLENYVLQHGTASYRWRYEFKDARVESTRKALVSMLAPYTKGSQKHTIRTHCHRIFDVLYAAAVPEKLHSMYQDCMQNGDHATARLHKQVWPAICNVFDKLVEMLGDETATTKVFAKTLEAGLMQASLGRVPPIVDQVVFGDIARSRYPQIKAMVVLGANENVLPPPPVSQGLFTAKERDMLRNMDVVLTADTTYRIAESYYSLYCALSQPSNKLIIIYPLAETNGKPLRPSPIIARIKEIYPQIKVQEAQQIADYSPLCASPPIQHALSTASSNLLYGNTISTTASRLESFARCPFAYFASYNLGIKPRARFEVLHSDLGNLLHNIIAQFAKEEWLAHEPRSLSRTDIATHVNNITTALASEVFHETARNRHILDKTKRIAISSIWALCQHLEKGSFSPLFSEYDLRTSTDIPLLNGKKLHLRGIVDRIDTLVTSGNKYVKIIDYKSGNIKFNIGDISRGTQLQLMIYMHLAANALGATPGGMFYFPVGNPLLDVNDKIDDALLDKSILAKYKMSGVTLTDIITGMDTSLTPGYNSQVAPLGILKNGNLSAATSALCADEFEQLSLQAISKVCELGARMTSGDIAAMPQQTSGKSPCEYCKFGGACGH